jgi:signal transduction histidine kinase
MPQVSRLQAGASQSAGPQVEAEHLYRVVDAIDEVAADTGKTVPQIALNWLLQRPTVASVIIGARTEEQLRQNEKLSALGLLAAEVAHEIRNPLTAIKARLFTQQKLLKSGSAEFEDAAVIGTEINRLERIVRDVLQFARPAEPNLVRVHAQQPLREVQDLLGAQLERNGIALKIGNVSDACICVDSQQLKQVLINLVQNAAESIGQDGTVTLSARSGNWRLRGESNPVVILEVADTGKGIPLEVQKRLFDPFFSTKESGTGLGLAIAARIVEKHGGALEFQTQLNHGTTFGIVLPEAAT